MNQFLIPFNINFYDAIKAYEKLDEIDWNIRTKMNIGDEVYFYCSNPIKKILLKGVVTDINIEFDNMIEDSEFYINKSDLKNGDGKRYTRIRKIVKLPLEMTDLLTLDLLRENGLKGNIRSTQMINKNKELFEYINSIY